MKAYALLDRPIDEWEAYDPDGAWRAGAIPGGLVVLRDRHGKSPDPCAARQAVFTGPRAAVKLIADAIWALGHHGEESPALPGTVAEASIEASPGVEVIGDQLGRRPLVYLVDATTAGKAFCGDLDYIPYDEWQERARAAYYDFVAGLAFEPITRRAVDVRVVERPPRRRHRDDQVAPAAPMALAVEPPPPPARKKPVQLSLFLT